jgi:DNA helicase-2/ATP-dependent DNA helicase PcrA
MLTLDDDRVALLEEVILGLDPTGELIPSDRKSILTLFDRLFAESYDGEAVTPGIHTPPDWLAPLFRTYRDRMIVANRLDFGALLSFAQRILRSRPAVARLLRLTWTHICVDEFQDTNKAQYDLLRLIVGEGNPNLFVVADDDQIIYQWNGASPERLQALKSDYQMAAIQLPENYRCPPAIVQLANNLIAHNRTRTPGKHPLVAARAAGGDNVLFSGSYDDHLQEAASVPAGIRSRGLAPEHCVVLARTTRLLHDIEHALQVSGFTTHLSRRKTEFQSPPAMLLYSVLRLANARHDREMLRRVCVAWQQVTEHVVEAAEIVAAATLRGGDFVRAWVERVADGAPEGTAPWLKRVSGALVERLDFLALVEGFLSSGLPGWPDDPDVADERKTWRELHEEVVREHGEENTTLHLYLQEMDSRSKASPAPPGAVQLLTIHGSKGLEFKHVFLVGMSEGNCPSFQAVKKGDHSREMEEERRNCFVAITRVCATLTISHARKYGGWANQPSRFLERRTG